ncbi:DUF7504 family protein [Halorarius halobius]|uniref:DUF7504 family protein n=1 Tax=Halorarius halobius TaxID=2962671 RepID=UPI0020CC7253|nr:hypothetical protein [Halorarius halobius]
MVTESGPERTETAAFTQALASLKRRGSNLLVVGAANDRAHTAACHRLLGDADAERTRVFVATDGSSGHAARGSDDPIVEYATSTRGAAAATPAESAGPSAGGSVRRVEDLATLGQSVAEAIDSVPDSELSPSELRLCFDSLRPLVEEHDDREVFRLLHAMTGDVRAVRGMGHYHLPLAFDSVTVRTLRPLFDAVVEVRSQGGAVQQRWHLNEAGITTDWLDL